MRAHAEGRFELVLSERLLAELEGVLARPKFRRYLTAEYARTYVASLRREGRIVADPDTAERVSDDPGDDYLVALARASAAHVLVSGDAHLTSLHLEQLRTCTPRQFLGLLP
jgi:uncharacterized protein